MQRQWLWGLGLAIALVLSGCGADSAASRAGKAIAEGDGTEPLALGKADVKLNDGSTKEARDWVDLDAAQATVTLDFEGKKEEVKIADIAAIEFEALALPKGSGKPTIRGEGEVTLELAEVKLDAATLRVPKAELDEAGIILSDAMLVQQLEFNQPAGESWQVKLEVGSQP